MPESRKRKGHPHRKPSDIPAKQRTKGRTTMAILFGAFGIIMSLFATDSKNYMAMVIGAIAGAAIGYFIGKKMEKGEAV
jgi:outer membrane lipoprotein SlyB